jgi:hypothetical protein
MKNLLAVAALLVGLSALGQGGVQSPVGHWRPVVHVVKGKPLSEEEGYLQDIRLSIARDGSFQVGPSWKQPEMVWHGTWHSTNHGLTLTFIRIGRVPLEKAVGGQLQPKHWTLTSKNGRLVASNLPHQKQFTIVFERYSTKQDHHSR